MATLTLDTLTVDVNEEGYLTDASQWTPELAHSMAGVMGLTLTEKHMEVLRYLRTQFVAGSPLSIRRVGKSGIVTIKEYYALFPGGPLKVSSKLAGIPKPSSCV